MIKIEYSHVIDMHWLYWTSRTPSLSFVTSFKRNSNVLTIWRTSAIEVTALFKKKMRSEMKDVQEKESITGVRVK